jgi:adenylate cyclase
VENQQADPHTERLDSEEEFDRFLARYADARDVSERSKIEEEVWNDFGASGAVFISDMSGFSRSTRALGICHFLACIRRVRPVVARAVGEHSGILLKAETDNCYAFFPEVDDALKAAIAINKELDRLNRDEQAADKLYISVGIDYGRLLLIGEVEYFGDPVNTASKLGEDLAARSEILVTKRAMERATVELDPAPDERRERISGIDIEYVSIDMAIRSR